MRLYEYLESENLTIKEFSRMSRITQESLNNYLEGKAEIRGRTRKRLEKFGIYEPGETIYEFYKNGHLLATGTLSECVKATGKAESTLYYYTTPSYKKRTQGFGIWGVKKASETAYLPSAALNSSKDNEARVIETIYYIAETKKGSVFLQNYAQVFELRKWLKSRGYKYETKQLAKNDYEIKFAKTG